MFLFQIRFLIPTLLCFVKGFHVLLCNLIRPHLFFNFFVFTVCVPFLRKQPGKFFVQILHLRNFSLRQFRECIFGRFMKNDFSAMFLQKIFTVPRFSIRSIGISGLNLIDNVRLDYFVLLHFSFCIFYDSHQVPISVCAFIR